MTLIETLIYAALLSLLVSGNMYHAYGVHDQSVRLMRQIHSSYEE